ncbi:hypothetical protein PLESTB_000926500 [Pleodorina starrii]|uniref:Aldehyde dehydrogenase domain-containing protein n=1 Tax=Pleodorina starrii TaxID=330485 RepID=A0A9W6F3L2_9CHLO|nr:hypothetical protein PLESTM_001558600 [Pleodorina starrii]GLC54974.1 hypothetical protein PLESTB_000926500 [Pleodorina starrii]GLC68463.1 hypothetical protein PLESTF_000694300 [Pleodorina starrii]
MTVLETVEGPDALIDQSLTVLEAKKAEWAALPLKDKIELLDAARLRLMDKMVSLGRIGAGVKACTDESMVVSEMLTSTAIPATYIHKLLATLRSLATTGKAPQLPVRTTTSGQLAVQVFPVSWADRNNLLQPGASAELVLRPEVKEVRQAELYDSNGRVKEGRQGVCAVLGAGNHGFLALKDVLVCLYERGQVVALKPHPQWFEWQRTADYVLQPFIQAGYLRSLYLPDTSSTGALLYHPKVDCVHMTGGTATHDVIVWGPSEEERKRRREANDPVLKVPITSELGCVTPFIVAPWRFTPAQLRLQAEGLVAAMTSNVGCNCNSAKVLVLPADWEQGPAFLENVRTVLRGTPMDPPYYAGIQERYRAFLERYPRCEVIEGPRREVAEDKADAVGKHLPYLINVMDELPTDPRAEYAFNVEPFAPVLTVVRLPTHGPVEFLEAATRFANEDLWGTLSAMVVLHPGLEAAHPEAVSKAIDGLRYGVVSVNAWSAVSFVVGACIWGAFDGDQTIADVGSGLGVVGNPYLLDRVQKAVYRVPLEGQAVPRPPHLKPLPLALARAAIGFLVSGWWGVLRAFWAR